MASLGNRLWHSDASFRVVPAQLLAPERPHRDDATAATPSSPTCAPPTTRSTTATKAEIEDLVCEHSLIYSRAQLGFANFTDEERHGMKPVLHRLVRTHPVTGRKSLFLSAHIGAIVGWPRPRRWPSSAT